MGRVADALVGHRRIGIDAPPLIYLIEASPRYGELARELFGLIRDGRVMGVTSLLTLM